MYKRNFFFELKTIAIDGHGLETFIKSNCIFLFNGTPRFLVKHDNRLILLFCSRAIIQKSIAAAFLFN